MIITVIMHCLRLALVLKKIHILHNSNEVQYLIGKKSETWPRTMHSAKVVRFALV